MSSALRITYTPRPNATLEGEIAALTNIYSFVIRCAKERNKGGCGATPEQRPASTRQKVITKEVSNVEL
jgi:hypothetical protein